MNIIGLDPGYGLIGWGVVSTSDGKKKGLSPVDWGCIETFPSMQDADRLRHIQLHILELLEKYKPATAVIERLFINKNLKTAAMVYQARGVLLAALAEFQCEILELTPNQIKQGVCGRGNAEKREVELMVRRLLHITENIRPDDTADALACAITGSFHLDSKRWAHTAKTEGKIYI